MKFLFDANLPPGLARAVSALAVGIDPRVEEVAHLRDRFNESTLDHVWLRALATERNWAVISQDGFAKSDVEKALIRRAGLAVFVLEPAWSKEKHWEKCVQLIRWWPKIVAQADLSTTAVRVPWNTTSKFRELRQ